MSILNPLTAIMYIETSEETVTTIDTQINTLKRLALIFDKIYYIMPDAHIFSEDQILDDPSLYERQPDGSILINIHHPMFFTKRTFSWLEKYLPHELKHTLDCFVDGGIAEKLNESQFDSDELLKIRNALMQSDIRDPRFNELSGTREDDLKTYPRVTPIRGYWSTDTDRKEHTLFFFEHPESIMDSYEITTLNYLAQCTSSCPIFQDNRQRMEMSYRYEQHQLGLKKLVEKWPTKKIACPEQKSIYGEVAFVVSSEVFASELLAYKSAEEILKYRKEMTDARSRLIYRDLNELSNIIQGNPWHKRTRKEVEAFITGKLTEDLTEFNIRSKALWEKLFGQIVVHLAEAIPYASVGGGASGILGSIIPNASPWAMILMGALAGASKAAPKIVGDIIDFIQARKNEYRTSIAYLASFK